MLVTSGYPRIPLDRCGRTIRDVVFIQSGKRRGQRYRAGGVNRIDAFANHAAAGLVEGKRKQYAIRDAVAYGHSRALQRRRRAGSAHADGHRIAQILDTAIGREMLRRRVKTRGNYAVDVVRLESRVGDRLARRLQHESEFGLAGITAVPGLADTDNAGSIFETAHVPPLYRWSRSYAACGYSSVLGAKAGSCLSRGRIFSAHSRMLRCAFSSGKPPWLKANRK